GRKRRRREVGSGHAPHSLAAGAGAPRPGSGILRAMRLSLGQRLMLGLYGLALRLAFPVTLYHLIWRGMRQREYLHRWGERYGWLEGKLDLHDTIWVHAVSVGEVIAAKPLVDGLLARHPGRPLLVTTITPT